MDDKRIDQIIDERGAKASALIQVLLDIQAEDHWLSPEALERVSQRLGVPLSKVQHTATFYKAFRLAPEARHPVHVCHGTSCHVRGAARVVESVQGLLGLRSGETAPDRRFSLETVTCLGRCASGPVVEVDGQHIAPGQAADVLKKCD